MVAKVRPPPGSGIDDATRVIVSVEPDSNKVRLKGAVLFGFKLKSNGVPSANKPEIEYHTRRLLLEISKTK